MDIFTKEFLLMLTFSCLYTCVVLVKFVAIIFRYLCMYWSPPRKHIQFKLCFILGQIFWYIFENEAFWWRWGRTVIMWHFALLESSGSNAWVVKYEGNNFQSEIRYYCFLFCIHIVQLLLIPPHIMESELCANPLYEPFGSLFKCGFSFRLCLFSPVCRSTLHYFVRCLHLVHRCCAV